MNMKIIQYDIRAVWNENKVKYMVFAGFIIIACICCNHSCKKLLSVDMGFWDYILWNLRGMKVIRKNEYIVPNAYWVLYSFIWQLLSDVYPDKGFAYGRTADSFEIRKSKGMVVRKSDLEYPVCSRILSCAVSVGDCGEHCNRRI